MAGRASDAPRQGRFPVIAASLGVGMLRAAWHLPMFLLEGTYQQPTGTSQEARPSNTPVERAEQRCRSAQLGASAREGVGPSTDRASDGWLAVAPALRGGASMATPDVVVPTPVGRRVERVSALDLMQLSADAGSVPNQVGAVLVLDAHHGFDADAAVALLGERIERVPRLRQRLVRVPVG